jgi:hypothetical protein
MIITKLSYEHKLLLHKKLNESVRSKRGEKDGPGRKKQSRQSD